MPPINEPTEIILNNTLLAYYNFLAESNVSSTPIRLIRYYLSFVDGEWTNTLTTEARKFWEDDKEGKFFINEEPVDKATFNSAAYHHLGIVESIVLHEVGLMNIDKMVKVLFASSL
ncbi:MAG: hypothetical protein FWE02_05520 [Defluviitaleaceae bacterium]|nr:hypothetical protein [Defluviitaleaceae bacterium]